MRKVNWAKLRWVLWLWRGWQVWDFVSWFGGTGLITAVATATVGGIRDLALGWQVVFVGSVLVLMLGLVATVLKPLRQFIAEQLAGGPSEGAAEEAPVGGRAREEEPDEEAAGASPGVREERIAERVVFLQNLREVDSQLTKVTHYNVENSLTHQFNQFCAEPGVLEFLKGDRWADATKQLLAERYVALARERMREHDRIRQLTAAGIGDDFAIRDECEKTRQGVVEYRDEFDWFFRFLDGLAVSGLPRFWDEPPWSVMIPSDSSG